ncbi:hypothetical protein [Cupriavidus sp. 8B]
MTDPHARLSHFVVLYSVPTGCVIVEVKGPVVIQLGPFPHEMQPQVLAMHLFPKRLVILLPPQRAWLDDEAVLILGNWACQARRHGRK